VLQLNYLTVKNVTNINYCGKNMLQPVGRCTVRRGFSWQITIRVNLLWVVRSATHVLVFVFLAGEDIFRSGFWWGFSFRNVVLVSTANICPHQTCRRTLTSACSVEVAVIRGTDHWSSEEYRCTHVDACVART
jgi:hypothetical protein